MAAATAQLASFETGHGDMVHDAAFDYYGKRLATCSSDRSIKVFEVVGDQITLLADLNGHEGPVWQVAWAHPKFGSLLASCSFDSRVIVWKEVSDNVWQQVYQSPLHSASVNSLCWAPYELGLVLAAASSDGSLSILTYQPDGSWHADKIDGAHPVGCTAVSWAPAAPKGSLVASKAPGQPVRRLASSGADNCVKVWIYNEQTRQWMQDGVTLTGHTDWVRDVAWAPSFGLPMNTLASAGQDGKVMVWTERQEGGWDRHVLHDFGAAVWRVSWSVSGNILSVSDANNQVTLWKEAADGQWQQITQ
ncbi:hypothetical protein ABPG77_001587 [Micractinium sp. CCAP 211/92]